jgi:hypothetical protein
MPVQDQIPLCYSNQYIAGSACEYCDGVIRHQPWCVTQSPDVHYAFQAVSDPGTLSLGDSLILHALGVVWTPEGGHARRGTAILRDQSELSRAGQSVGISTDTSDAP